MARTLVTIIFMLICLVMIIVVMMQESKNSGFGALSGQVDSDSYVRKNRGRTKEGKLENYSNSWIFILCSSHRPLPEGFPVILKQTNDAVSIRKLN